MDHHRAIATFVHTAQAGNFSAAARHLQVTPQSISIQISQLEQWIGHRLFHRTTRKISLTEEGAALYERCKGGIAAIDEGVRSLREKSDEAAGTVRLAVPYGISQALVVGLLPRFLALYPSISIELLVDNGVPDIVEQAVDVGIVGGVIPASSLVARRITSFQMILCAATSYLEAHGTPRSMEDLRTHRCINLRHHRTGKIMPWTFSRKKEVITLDVPGSLIVNDNETHRRAVLYGAGIGQVANFFAAPFIRNKTLKPLLLGYVAAPIDLYLYLPRRTQVPKKNRLLADFLVQELRSHPDLQRLAGTEKGTPNA